ncbi:hypothetical protein B9Z55_022956 [Caenorhabditis nigoni]|uniref:Zinc finger PHD-type domain-containing protein n=1 Tax=Caenorhabditis nigoni TaxID=1611254 RepID=A0A2G5SMG8_9PELO|nr:hypothetical protein B9Z55_022956 [Caenorhabditis nigoni]
MIYRKILEELGLSWPKTNLFCQRSGQVLAFCPPFAPLIYSRPLPIYFIGNLKLNIFSVPHNQYLIFQPGSPSLLCMYHECKNRYHRECTRLSSIAFNHFSGTPQARWVCPTCEAQVRPAPMPMQHA